MNIEDLAKDTKDGKQPLKKKGYDDVEVSDLSDDDDKKDKQSKRKDVKDPGKKKPPKEGKNPKAQKSLKKEPTGPPTKTQPSERALAAADLKNTQTAEDGQPRAAQQQNIAAIPRHSGTAPTERSSKKQGCCVLM